MGRRGSCTRSKLYELHPTRPPTEDKLLAFPLDVAAVDPSSSVDELDDFLYGWQWKEAVNALFERLAGLVVGSLHFFI
jgi:hypothetical protein